ncbi:hypothetical protein COW64_12375 [bacterium (Candidatus Blackallbacteria) CG18_big_fil_WC_8_21_14_2_50_49_26]|nr:MAG: hypothetical protein COW64_12375 [bacterium (Candidatus Blackallbacteria) CG18_big_fil_WC_8_21_14_2_50_49_26]
MNIKITNPCLAAGEHQDAGNVLVVGKDIAQEEADKLVRMSRAVEVAQEEKPAEKKSGKVK